MSGQPQPQFDLEADDYPLPPIVFDPGEADECERDVASASYNYSGLMAIGKPKRKKTMALVIDAEELFKANQQLAVNAAQDFADAVKSERVSVLESLGEDESLPAGGEDGVCDAEADCAPGLDDFDDQVDAAVLAWSQRTITLSDEADLIEEAVAEDAAIEETALSALDRVKARVAPMGEMPAESVIERAARLRDAIPDVPVHPVAPIPGEQPVASEPPAAPEWPVADIVDEPSLADEPACVREVPEHAFAQALDNEPAFAAEMPVEPQPVAAPVAAPAPVPASIANHGHALRARIVREPVEETRSAGGGSGLGDLIARFFAWLKGLRG